MDEFPEITKALDAVAFLMAEMHNRMQDCTLTVDATESLAVRARKVYIYDDPAAFDYDERDRRTAETYLSDDLRCLAASFEDRMQMILKALRGDPAEAIADHEAAKALMVKLYGDKAA